MVLMILHHLSLWAWSHPVRPKGNWALCQPVRLQAQAHVPLFCALKQIEPSSKYEIDTHDNMLSMWIHMCVILNLAQRIAHHCSPNIVHHFNRGSSKKVLIAIDCSKSISSSLTIRTDRDRINSSRFSQTAFLATRNFPIKTTTISLIINHHEHQAIQCAQEETKHCANQ